MVKTYTVTEDAVMTREWQIIQSVDKSAQENMELDQKLLQTLDPQGPAILHLYGWKNQSATFGHFINPKDYLKHTDSQSIDLAKRPTGGGIIFHLTDLAFSILIPETHILYSLNTLQNYHTINTLVIQTIQKLFKGLNFSLLPEETPFVKTTSQNFCMAKPTQFDVMINGRKFGGAAQRKTKKGFLHQGTLLLKPLPFLFLEELLYQEVLEDMRQNSYSLFDDTISLTEARKEVKHLLIQTLKEVS